MNLWLYLHFPALQLDSLAEAEKDVAIAIVNKHSHQVMQCNAAAKAAGVQPNMGLASAAALCAHLQVVPYDADIENNRLKEIAQWLYLVTADLVLMPPQGLLIRASHMLQLYSGLAGYWQVLSAHLKPLSLRFHYACAYSPLAAMLLAKAGNDLLSDDRDAIALHLGQHDLQCTELSVETVEKLRRVGINTLADLLALPLAEVARRFDIDLVNYLGRLTGQFKHPVDFYHPPAHFRQELELLYEIENVQWLEKPLSKLLKQLENHLRLQDQVAYELALTLQQREGQRKRVIFTSAQGDYLWHKWQTLACLTLESLTLDAPVTRLTLEVQRQGEHGLNKAQLFSKSTGVLSAAELCSLLQAKLGNEAVVQPSLKQDPRPEKATDYRPVLQSSPHLIPDCHALRPSFLLTTPEVLRQQVDLIHGPERVVSGWWDGDDVMRDYFIARTHDGQWLWIFRDPQQRWFVHGLFC